MSEGCRVCICARGAERLAAAAAALEGRAGGPDRVLAVRADLTETTGVETVVARTVETFGGLDILVNNVGRAGGGGLLEVSDDEWRRAFDDTLYPAIRASRLAVPHMQRRGGGVILIVASIWGRESGGRMTYNAVKAAEISLAKALAQQLAGDNIRVNSVAPGSISFPGGSWDRRQRKDPEEMAAFRAGEPSLRPLWTGRGSWRRCRLPGIAQGQLGQRRQRHRRWVSVPLTESSGLSHPVLTRRARSRCENPSA